MVQSSSIHRHARVLATDGDFGRVTHVVVDPQTRAVTHIVTKHDGAEWQIPSQEVVDATGDRVVLRGDRARYYRGDIFDRDLFHTVDDDDVEHDREDAATRDRVPLLDAEDEQVDVAFERPARSPAYTTRPTADQNPYRLQLREEQLRVEKEQQQIGAVRLGKRVSAHTETVNVPVREERLIIERRPGSGELVAEVIDPAVIEVIEVHVHAERVMLRKEVVVAEDVALRKETVERTEEIDATVRREELVVEGDADLLAAPLRPEDAGDAAHEHYGRGTIPAR